MTCQAPRALGAILACCLVAAQLSACASTTTPSAAAADTTSAAKATGPHANAAPANAPPKKVDPRLTRDDIDKLAGRLTAKMLASDVLAKLKPAKDQGLVYAPTDNALTPPQSPYVSMLDSKVQTKLVNTFPSRFLAISVRQDLYNEIMDAHGGADRRAGLLEFTRKVKAAYVFSGELSAAHPDANSITYTFAMHLIDASSGDEAGAWTAVLTKK